MRAVFAGGLHCVSAFLFNYKHFWLCGHLENKSKHTFHIFSNLSFVISTTFKITLYFGVEKTFNFKEFLKLNTYN